MANTIIINNFEIRQIDLESFLLCNTYGVTVEDVLEIYDQSGFEAQNEEELFKELSELTDISYDNWFNDI